MEDNTQNSTLAERPATPQDALWLWEQYSELLKPSVDRQWGWDEAFQLSNFQKHLPHSLFSIVENRDSPVASYATEIKEKCIYLHMLLVVSEHQSHGVGTHVMSLIKARASEISLPIELSVIPANQVAEFYENNGFKMIEATADKQLFRWVSE